MVKGVALLSETCRANPLRALCWRVIISFASTGAIYPLHVVVQPVGRGPGGDGGGPGWEEKKWSGGNAAAQRRR